jgi:site-specific DNA recombinase
MKYLIYSRVSERGSDWQGETSCEAQEAECRRDILARDKKATFVPELREEFVSGTKLVNRKLAQTLKDAESGRAEWDVLVALDLDRLFRSTEECLTSFRIISAAGKGVILVRQNIDLASPYGRFTLTILAAVAQLTAQIGAQKTRDKMFHIARRGEWPCGKVPMGYKRAGKRDNALVIDAAPAAKVKAMFSMAASGSGPVAIARAFDLAKNTTNKILSNRIYTGRLIYGDIDVEGKHPAIVTDVEFRAAQGGRPEAGKPRVYLSRQQYPYLLTGLIRCECGGMLSPATCKGTGGKYAYYRCQSASCHSKARYVRADAMDRAVIEAIADMAYNPQAVASLAKCEAEKHAAYYSDAQPEIKRLKLTVDGLKAQIDRLTSAIANSDPSAMPGAYAAVMAALEEKQGEYDKSCAALVGLQNRTAGSDTARDARAMIDAVASMARTLASGDGDPQTRRDWVKAHVESISSTGVSWRLRFYVPFPGVSSTGGELWHPLGVVVELMITLPSRRAA